LLHDERRPAGARRGGGIEAAQVAAMRKRNWRAATVPVKQAGSIMRPAGMRLCLSEVTAPYPFTSAGPRIRGGGQPGAGIMANVRSRSPARRRLETCHRPCSGCLRTARTGTGSPQFSHAAPLIAGQIKQARRPPRDIMSTPNASPCPVSGSRRQQAEPQQVPAASVPVAASPNRPQPCHARVHRGYPQWIHWDRRREVRPDP
jgi:hypothetical protein